MKLNLLADINESRLKGPGRRLANLLLGFDRLSIPYELCGSNLDFAVGLQGERVLPWMKELPAYTPIGPNVMHEASANPEVVKKFKNMIVQSEWVANYWKWSDPDLTRDLTFFIYPAAADTYYWNVERKPTDNCLFYTKYQSGENKDAALQIIKNAKHTYIEIEYGGYSNEQLKRACAMTEYCIYNSCCEKSSNALMEILSTGLPVYVVNSTRWIGRDTFDQCSSAPHFSAECGLIGNNEGLAFDVFYDKVKRGEYKPRDFVLEGYSVEKTATRLLGIAEACHG